MASGIPRKDIRDIKYEVFEAQSQIIKLQAEALDKLFLILTLQGVTDEEMSKATTKINEAAQIRAEHQL